MKILREVILGDDVVGEMFAMDSEVFISLEGGTEVVVVNVHNDKAGRDAILGIRDHAVNEGFDYFELGGVCRDDTCVIDAITTDSASNAPLDTRVFLFLFHLWVVVTGVTTTVEWLFMTMDWDSGACVDELAQLSVTRCEPSGTVGAFGGFVVGERSAISMEVEDRSRVSMEGE